MVETASRQLILDYLDACYAGDIDRASAYYDDDIDFICYAPVELFPALGQKRGKAAVIGSLVDRLSRFEVVDHTVNFIVADDTSVATAVTLRVRQKATDRI